MANYSPTNFIVPLSPNDKTIQIRDKSGVVKYNVAPCNVTSSFAFSNLVKIRSLGTDFVLTLDFDTVNFAKDALTQFQDSVNFVKSHFPCPNIGQRGPTGPAGPTGPGLTSMTFYQFTSSATWSFNHNLNRVPSVTIYNWDGYEIVGLIKSATSSVDVYFNTGLTGSLYLV